MTKLLLVMAAALVLSCSSDPVATIPVPNEAQDAVASDCERAQEALNYLYKKYPQLRFEVESQTCRDTL